MFEIWHNPRCSKSRQALAILEDAEVEVNVRLYTEDAPSVAELDRVLRALDLEPRDLVRFGEAAAKDNDLKNRSLSRSEWLEAMVAAPILIERPVVVRDDGRAVLGRPPEKVRELL